MNRLMVSMCRYFPFFMSISILIIISFLISCDKANIRPLSDNQIPEFVLLTPETLNQDISAFQRIHIFIDNQSFRYESAIEITRDNIEVLLLSPWGQRIATLNYDGEEFSVVAEKGAHSKLPLRRIFGIMQMIYWPMIILEEQLADTKWRIAETSNIRKIYYDQKLIGIAEYDQEPLWAGKVIFRDIIYNYQIDIKSALLD